MKKSLLFTAFVFFSILCFSQDIILLKRGTRLEAKVTEITPTLVRYKLFAEPNGRIYFVYKDDIVSIMYQDGRVETFNQSDDQITESENSSYENEDQQSDSIFRNQEKIETKSQPANIRKLTNDIKPVETTDILKIEPFSYISLIEKGNKSVINDSISNITKKILDESLETFREKLHLSSGEIKLTDSIERVKLEEEIRDLIISADSKKNVKNVPITPLLDSLLNTNNKRYGLIIVQSGFTRTKGDYRGQIAKGVGLGVLTGVLTGMAYYQVPIKAHSTLYAMIYDNQNKNITFYNKSSQDKEPTPKGNIIKQFNKVFEKYFGKNNKNGRVTKY